MDLLQAEISRKRKATAALRIEEAEEDGELGTKYIKQSSALQAEEKELLKQLEEDNGTDENSSDVSIKEVPPEEVLDAPTEKQRGSRQTLRLEIEALTSDELVQRLRTMGEPISIFGETDTMKKERLVTVITKSREEVEAPKKAAQVAVESHSSRKVKEEEDVGVCTHYSDDLERMGAEKVIFKYFKNLIKQWERDLEGMSVAESKSAKGRAELTSQRNVKERMKALFDLCKRKEIPEDIKKQLLQMVTCCEKGDFRSAHEHYLQAAIGNAAWPIGVTNVGIHQRGGRDKLNEGKVAHVMNNEMQRKYFTSVKRLLSYAQTKRPDIPPSMKVL